MSETTHPVCPQHPHRKVGARLHKSDCPWCQQIDVLFSDPSSAGIYRHVPSNSYFLLKRVEKRPGLSDRYHGQVWGETASTYAPESALVRVDRYA